MVAKARRIDTMNTLDFSRVDQRHRGPYSFNPPSDTLCGRIWIMRCTLPAYTQPVPDGRMSAGERDALATKLGFRWTEKALRGEPSCAWHECAEYAGTRCDCARCSPKARFA